LLLLIWWCLFSVPGIGLIFHELFEVELIFVIHVELDEIGNFTQSVIFLQQVSGIHLVVNIAFYIGIVFA
jgi:hypothetical protein